MKIPVFLLIIGFLLLPLEAPDAQFSSQDQQTDNLSRIDSLNAEVVRLFRLGKFDDALPLARQLVELNEKAHGPQSLAVAGSTETLAELLIAKGKYKDAEPHLLRTIEINDKELKPVDLALIRPLKNYTCVLYLTEQDKRLAEFEKNRRAILENSTEPDRFWGAIWRLSKIINFPKPDYPPGAKGIASGRIMIEVVVDETGKVISAQNMCGGNVLLVEASLRSARVAQFQPIVVQGRPIRVKGYLQFRFENQ